MSRLTRARSLFNRFLRPINLRLDTLTSEKHEMARLQEMRRSGYFKRPAFPVPATFEGDFLPIIQSLECFGDRLVSFVSGDANDVGYKYDNPWFGSPDAEILYTMVRVCKPAQIIEVGSGNSTRVSKQAVIDGKFQTVVTSIDPRPRSGIDHLVDRLYRQPVEQIDGAVFDSLEPGDILFIDSTHEIRAGNDVTRLYLEIIPRLQAGVVIHVHDVFLPYEYPEQWLIQYRREWNEQYLVQCLLMGSSLLDVLWPGHYLQRTRDEFATWFPHCTKGQAQSLWLRRRS